MIGVKVKKRFYKRFEYKNNNAKHFFHRDVIENCKKYDFFRD